MRTSDPRSRTRKWVVGSLAALALAASGPLLPAPRRVAERPQPKRISEILLAARADPRPDSAEFAGARLARLGPEAIPALFEILESGVMSPAPADGRDRGMARDRPVDAGSEAIVVAALGRFSRSRIVGPVARLLTASRPEGRPDGPRVLGQV